MSVHRSSSPQPLAPRSRVLAIGDIHGCLRAFDTLLAVVRPTPDDWIVTIGDYIDRGPDSRGVLDRLLELDRTGRLIPILGNHEEMLLAARARLETFLAWQQSGGQQTLDSYEPGGNAQSFDVIPAEHWRFFERRCVSYFETDTHFFVHAGADPNVEVADQTDHMLRWAKTYAPLPHRSGKVMIYGHTPQQNGLPAKFGHAVGIDTWAYGEGWLTCLDAASGDYWQANQKGETRQGRL